VAVLLVALFLVASGVFYALARSAQTRWERLAEELRAKGQPLTYAEIEGTRTPSADASNGAATIREAGQALKSVTGSDESGVLLLDSECQADFFEGKGIRRSCLPPTRKYVEARKQALTLLSGLARDSDIRLDISYEGTIFDTSTRELEAASRHRALSKLVNLDAILATIDGDVSAAVDALVLQLRLSEPLYAEPGNLLQLAAIATDSQVVTTFEDLLRAHELSDNELNRLQTACSRHLQRQTLKPSLLGLRASFIRNTDKDQLRADTQAALARLGVPPKKPWRLPNPVDWIPFEDDWFIYESRIQGITILTRLLDNSDDLSKLLDVARQQQASLPRFGPGGLLIRILLPSLVRGIELHARIAARFRCMPVVIAAERFRLANGRFPVALDELVPAYLPELPRDPFNGQAIRIAKTGSGMVVYSVGENAVDDGGEVVPAKGERLGRDLGIRLSDPAERGVRIIEDEANKP